MQNFIQTIINMAQLQVVLQGYFLPVTFWKSCHLAREAKGIVSANIIAFIYFSYIYQKKNFKKCTIITADQ